MATIAVFIARGGGAYAAVTLPNASVGKKQMKPSAVTSSKVMNRSLLRRDFRRGQIPAGPQGTQGIPGAPGAPGVPGASGAPGAPGARRPGRS